MLMRNINGYTIRDEFLICPERKIFFPSNNAYGSIEND